MLTMAQMTQREARQDVVKPPSLQGSGPLPKHSSEASRTTTTPTTTIATGTTYADAGHAVATDLLRQMTEEIAVSQKKLPKGRMRTVLSFELLHMNKNLMEKSSIRIS